MAAPIPKLDRTIPLDHGPWTVEDWLDLPASRTRVELVDGMLLVSPVETSGNARLMLRITGTLTAAAPPDLEVLPPVNVGLGAQRVLIPDFCVIKAPGLDTVIVAARHVVLVGEIASPSTRVHDRTTKRALYAEAGIPLLVLVDPGEVPDAVCCELRDGEYAEIARSGHGVLELSRPFPVVLDLTAPARPPGA